MHYLKSMLAAGLVALLAACGGGGGSPGGSGPSGTGGVSTGTPTIVVSLADASGAAVTSIAVGGGYVARATVRDSAGAVVSNRLVTFAVSNGSIATLTPDTALTNSSGVAQVAIAPASITALGASQLTANALVGTTAVTGQADFAVSASNLTLSAITVGSASLASGGNTSLEVTALVGGVASTGVPVNVTFSASCGRINGVASFSATTNGSGVASTVYSAVAADGTLCSGPVTISAASPGAASRSTTVNVASPVANAITFVSATPGQIYVAGSGALEQSVVKFKVLAGSTPLANVAVRFSLAVNPGGVGLSSSGSSSDVTGTTDAVGEVSISVYSGTIPGPVRVRATLVSNTAVFAETQNLTVSSGPPSQRFMSLSASVFNIEGATRDGSSSKLTVRLADRQGNPVENGTVVNFTAEGGQVASSCATVQTSGISSCSVDFVSQNPRPTGGRVSVLAFTSGTKDYTDVNGNNRYDDGTDTLISLGDAYRDDNENAAFESGEFVVPRGGTATCTGAGAPFPSRANTCDTSLATTVRQQVTLLFSSSTPKLVTTSVSNSLVEFTLASIDYNLLPMPSGTVVTADTGDTTANTVACTVDKIFNSTIPNISPTTDPTTSLITSHQITLKDCATGDRLLITVTTPGGLATTFPQVLP